MRDFRHETFQVMGAVSVVSVVPIVTIVG